MARVSSDLIRIWGFCGSSDLWALKFPQGFWDSEKCLGLWGSGYQCAFRGSGLVFGGSSNDLSSMRPSDFSWVLSWDLEALEGAPIEEFWV